MKTQIKKLEEKKQYLTERLMKVDTAIKALQDICDHVYLFKAHDHNYNYYECEICGHKYSK